MTELKVDHQFTDEITCPSCGEEYPDSWECLDSGILECCNCNADFVHERNIEITYTTTLKEKQ